MARKYSSISTQTTLAAGISGTATTMTVATGTGAALLGGITLAAGNVDQFTVAIDPDTASEEIVFVTAVTSDTFTIVRGRAGTSAIVHSGGATVKHVLTGEDLTYFETTISSAVTASGSATLTNKTVSLGNNTLTGTTAQFNTALTDNDFATLAGTETLTNKTLTAPTINFNQSAANYPTFKSPQEITTVSATAATGTINYDVNTQGVLYYTSNASANWTVNFRASSGATLSSILDVGDSVTVAFLVTQGTTAYYNNVVQIDGTTVTPKWQSTPTAGNASSVDVYTYTIIKTAATPTYTVFASQTKFA